MPNVLVTGLAGRQNYHPRRVDSRHDEEKLPFLAQQSTA